MYPWHDSRRSWSHPGLLSLAKKSYGAASCCGVLIAGLRLLRFHDSALPRAIFGPELLTFSNVAVSECAELSAAWALVCIPHILATDSLALDDKNDSEIVMPPPRLDPPECPVVNVNEQQDLWVQKCKCHYCGFRCCRAGKPHMVHQCKRHTNW